MPSHPLSIAVIVVGYKSLPYLPDCLSSLAASTHTSHTVYFLDNASNDGSIEYIKENFPEVVTHTSPKNLGFAGGNNFLISKALEGKAEAFFLLNPDTIVDKECLATLAENYEPDTLLQPLILLHENGKATDLVNTWGNPLHYLGFSYAGGNRQPLPDGKGSEIALASGAAVLIPRKVLETVGLFDESFFLYHEDVDLSWRCRLRGYQIRSLYAAKVWHKYSFSQNSSKFYFAERNRLLFVYKNYQSRTLLLTAPIGALTEVFMLLFSLTKGWGWQKVRSYGGFLALLPAAHASRKLIQKTRTVKDKELYPLLSANLSFSEVDSAPLKLYNLLSRLCWGLIRAL